jgi:hypothetical protein
VGFVAFSLSDETRGGEGRHGHPPAPCRAPAPAAESRIDL